MPIIGIDSVLHSFKQEDDRKVDQSSSNEEVPLDQSMHMAVSFHPGVFSPTETPERSLYVPSSDSVLQLTSTPFSRTRMENTVRKDSSPIEKMNTFLESRDISPVRNVLALPWTEASDRTRRRHMRKARQAVGAVLEEIAPRQSISVWKTMVASKVFLQDSFSDSEDDDEGDEVDTVLMDAIADCYKNASTWQVRRQILSIVAGKLTFRKMQRWLPDLTRYRFSAARDHALRQGKGAPPPSVPRQTKMFVTQTQIDHFRDFITSPHIIQDLPFGKKSITLSTKEVLTVPNVIRMQIPESIVKQYRTYCEESNFVPLSRSSLLNILSVCKASTRKSLQGLDYISSAGTQAFDDLHSVVERLGDEVMGMSWAKEQTEHLRSAKRYLKSDFKVFTLKNIYIIYIVFIILL